MHLPLLFLPLAWSAPFRDTPDWTVAGPTPNFYQTVAAAGDVNGDGYDDMLAGEGAWDDGLGRVWLFLGSAAGLSATAAMDWTGEEDNVTFGDTVLGAGDVNGDGYDDVIVTRGGHTSEETDIWFGVRVPLRGRVQPETAHMTPEGVERPPHVDGVHRQKNPDRRHERQLVVTTPSSRRSVPVSNCSSTSTAKSPKRTVYRADTTPLGINSTSRGGVRARRSRFTYRRDTGHPTTTDATEITEMVLKGEG